MNRLEGKTAAITGAGSGIGREAARLFAEEGARLVLNDIDAASLEQTAALVAEGVEPTDKRLAAVLQGERGEAERKAAARLEVDLRSLAVLSVGLWGRSLTQEREARVQERTPPSAGSQSIRTMKGHVTRELLAELEKAIGGGP